MLPAKNTFHIENKIFLCKYCFPAVKKIFYNLILDGYTALHFFRTYLKNGIKVFSKPNKINMNTKSRSL